MILILTNRLFSSDGEGTPDTGGRSVALRRASPTPAIARGGARQAVVELLARDRLLPRALRRSPIALKAREQPRSASPASIGRSMCFTDMRSGRSASSVGDGYEPLRGGRSRRRPPPSLVCDSCGRISAFEDAGARAGDRPCRRAPRSSRRPPRRPSPWRTARAAKRAASVRVSAAILVAEALTVGFGDNVAIRRPHGCDPQRRQRRPARPERRRQEHAVPRRRRPRASALGRDQRRERQVAFVPQRLDVEPAFPVTARDVVRMGRYGDLGWLERFGCSRPRSRRRARSRRSASAHLAGAASATSPAASASACSSPRRSRRTPSCCCSTSRSPESTVRPTSRPPAARRLARQGRTVIVATHDLESAARDYDLVLCLNRRLVAFGPPAEACTEAVLAETFSGHVLRVGDLIVDVSHHHHGAG